MKTCACSREAVRKDKGEWACARCLEIESKLEFWTMQRAGVKVIEQAGGTMNKFQQRELNEGRISVGDSLLVLKKMLGEI
jgi:hypothetical protein